MRLFIFLLVALVSAGSHMLAQTVPNADVSTATNTTPALETEADKNAWSFYASAYTYLVPDSRDYVQPSFTADHGWLHLEARYNYEALDTGSVWVGYNFSGGEKLTWEFTPMLGGAFGETAGIAPGYRASISYWKLTLSSEGEYLFDTGNSSDSFFYNWSELTLASVDRFRFGLVTQRTRAYESDRAIQRGLLLGFNYKKVDLSAYLFNPDDDKPTFVIAVKLSF